jgi:hypothetical protein
MADVWFQTNSAQAVNSVPLPGTAQISALTTSQVASINPGNQVSVTTSAQVSGLTASQIAALTPQQVSTQNKAAGLQSQVGGMVQAMGVFSQVQSTSSNSSGIPLLNTQSSVNSGTGTHGISVNLIGMASTLQQFDINGTAVAQSPVMAAATASNLITTSPQSNIVNNGMLIAGGK